MFTSVTNHSLRKGTLTYLGLTLFCVLFTFIYEKYSYGESSPYMRLMFLAPLAGMTIFFLSLWQRSWIQNRLALLLFNSTIGILVSGCLIKGIIEISGRTTTVEQPYWYAAILFLTMSVLAGLLPKKTNQAKFSQTSRLRRYS